MPPPVPAPGSAAARPDAPARRRGARSELFVLLASLLNPAGALLFALGIAGRWQSDVWLPIAIVGGVELAGSIGLSLLTRSWDGVLATRIVSTWNWIGLTIIFYLDGGYPSPFWVFGFLSGIATGVMTDLPGVYGNTIFAVVAMTAPRLATGLDLQTATGIAMAAVIIHVTGLAVYRSAKKVGEEQEKEENAEAALRDANAHLTRSVARLEDRDREAASITAMGRLLQSTATRDELCGVLGSYITELFPHDSGAVYLYSASRNDLEAAVTWGAFSPDDAERLFAPDECWALRQGQPYRQDHAHPGLHCGHVRRLASGFYLCAPLVARGDTLGVLHVRSGAAQTAGATRTIEETTALIASIAEYVSLALANQMLRETLRNQAIRDPLTGLFNRRFAEETLERELLRAARGHAPLSLIFFDIDHFKVFNDTYGHEAGDLVLQQLGTCLKENLRAEDVACRFGGEEFLVILADTAVDTARQRAELIREQFKARTIKFGSQFLGHVTVSLGLAAYPANGRTPDTLVAAADAALYRAKAAGRDRVVVADEGTGAAGTPQP